MPTHEISLTPEPDYFISEHIESGRFTSASDVVRAALLEMEREERVYQVKLEALRAAIDEGDQSGIAEGDPFERAFSRIRELAAEV